MNKRFSHASLVFLFLLQAGVSMSYAQEPYYKGKTIRFLVNFSAGGPTDVFGRLIARYFPKHVAGNPSVTVQNMGGAGGIIGANYVYEIAKPDGLTIGVFSGMYLPQILGGSGVRYDLNKMPIIAGAAETSIVYIRTDTEVKSPADLLKPAKPIIVGGFTRENNKDLALRLAFELLGPSLSICNWLRGRCRASHCHPARRDQRHL
jgi:tripartite-type tricarboxylate transporter receptor subunit TctC